MTPADLRLFRTLLFLPASNPRAVEKARELDADLVVLDLEDAVKPDDKASARRAAAEAVAEGMGGKPVAIRTNVTGSKWYGEDVVAIRHSKVDLVILPKVESKQQIHDAGWLIGKPVLAMIETARGVIAAPQIAQSSAALIVGGNDLAADLGLPPDAGREGLAYGRQAAVVAARAASIAVFDGVFNGLEDLDGLARDCEQGRAFGFDGKSLIHPSQIDTANRIFGPREEEIEAAQRLIQAASGGAERFEGRMIESMHVDQAHAVLAKARR